MSIKKVFGKMDKWLLILCLIYTGVGLITVLSASSVTAVLNVGESPYYYFLRQLMFFGVAYAAGFFVLFFIPTKDYKKYVPLGLLFIIGCLIFLLIYGQVVGGVKSWIGIGSFGIQPSEFAKILLIVYFGVFFGNETKKRAKYYFVIPLTVAIFIFFLVAAQPDFGTATIIAIIVFLTFLAIPIPNNKIISYIKIAGSLALIIVFVVLFTGILTNTKIFNEEQISRFEYEKPCTRYTDETGYQVCNGFIAINGGGLLGKGLGNSSQKYLYLPAAYTDFIFAIFVEECGVIFGALLIAGYLLILWRILKIAKESFTLRNSIICYGIAIYMLTHLVLNLCGILALIPLTGVPVPFMSYGGSFAITMVVSMFIVQRICIENKIAKTTSEIKSI